MVSQYSLEDSYCQKEKALQIIESIEDAFSGLQDRQKNMIADLLTAKLLPIINDVLNIKKPTFFSENVMNHYRKTGKILLDKEIGAEYGKHEANVSRAYKNFIMKIKIQNDE